MPLPKDMHACMSKVKDEHPEGRSKEKKGKKAAHKQHIAMCLNAGYTPTFAEFLAEADEERRIKAKIADALARRERTRQYVGGAAGGGEVNPQYRRIQSELKALRAELATHRERTTARSEIETGREAMKGAPPPGERPVERERTTLSGQDLEEAIRMAIETLTGNKTDEESRVSGEMVSDWIRRNLGEHVDRRRVDKELSDNPNLRDLEKFRKMGKMAGTTDRDRELRYMRNLKTSY